MRPWHTWLIFSLCMTVVVAAMGWHSLAVLQLDRAEANAIHQAAVEERVRLALWRMDSALAPLIAQESSWPYFAYTSFSPTERAYTNMLNPVQPGEILVASPLLDLDSPQVLVHFQIAPDGSLSSPQVPTGQMRQMAEERYVTREKVDLYTRRLAELRPFLNRQNLLAMLKPVEPAPVRVAVLPRSPGSPSAQPAAPNPSVDQQADVQSVSGLANAVTGLDLQQREARLNQQISMQHAAVPQPDPRQQVETSTQQYNQPAYPAQQRAPQRQSSTPQQKPSGKTGWISPGQQDLMNSNDAQARGLNFDYNGAVVVSNTYNSRILRGGVKEGMTRPLWIGDTLLLARRARVNGEEYIQGCWLDWPGINAWLLGEIRDLLPNARIEALRGQADPNDTRRLAALPVRLVPGSIPAPAAEPLSPIRMSLLIAWLCVLLAVGATIALLVGTMSLSERRAAFVSAVTHEMRTPLTTFRMYTEMLTGGMVPTEDKRRRYLDTLRIEAERLSHLVENVLAYARLERNRATSVAQTMPLSELISRVQSRLADRAAQAGMELAVCLEGETTDAPVCVDASAVEQILFNLVDNACKYAVSASDRRIHLETAVNGRLTAIRVRDHGPGISACEADRLFRPFSKSAKDAANSAPGVGLGLALSRRLARHMGGNLRLDAACDNGACFVLALPQAR